MISLLSKFKGPNLIRFHSLVSSCLNTTLEEGGKNRQTFVRLSVSFSFVHCSSCVHSWIGEEPAHRWGSFVVTSPLALPATYDWQQQRCYWTCVSLKPSKLEIEGEAAKLVIVGMSVGFPAVCLKRMGATSAQISTSGHITPTDRACASY